MKQHTTTNGFAMLFTVLVMSLILTIAVGISNTTFKQTILSSLAKDSQAAFYQADSAMECALYYDITKEWFALNLSLDQVPLTLACGDAVLSLDTIVSSQNYLLYTQRVTDPTKGCFGILFDKATNPLFSVVQAKGYNVCQDNPRKVERVLEVRYAESPSGSGVIVPPIDPGLGGGTFDPITPVGGDLGGEISPTDNGGGPRTGGTPVKGGGRDDAGPQNGGDTGVSGLQTDLGE